MRWRWSRATADGRPPTDERDRPKAKRADDLLRCPLCGKSFHAGEAAQCGGCPLAARCGLVMCPNCSYEFAA